MKVIAVGTAQAIRKKGNPIIVGEPEVTVLNYNEESDLELVAVAVKFGFADPE